MRTQRGFIIAGLVAVSSLLAASCGVSERPTTDQNLSGDIAIDGSSTVAPLSESLAERFHQDNPGVQLSVAASGTGGGFEKFCSGQTAISDASRHIDDEERRACAQNGIRWEEITVANDALTVAVNIKNPVSCVSTEQLADIYGPHATATNWNQIPGLQPPFDSELAIFSPGADSGTFDYFTEAVNGEEGAQRSTGINIVGEDDNATVVGVAGSPGGIGYFGYSFFQQNQFRLKALQIRNAAGDCTAPAPTTAQNGSYNPLGRQLYLYISDQAFDRPEVRAFIDFYLTNVNDVTQEVGFIPLTDEQLQQSTDKVASLAS